MRREATIYAGRPIQAPAVVKPQDKGYRRSSINATAYLSDIHHMRRRGAKSFVDDLVLSRGVVLSRAELFCDLLRLSLTTRRFVRCRRTYLTEWVVRASDRASGRLASASIVTPVSCGGQSVDSSAMRTRDALLAKLPGCIVGGGRTRGVDALIPPLARSFALKISLS